jgi:hypothetical protein
MSRIAPSERSRSPRFPSHSLDQAIVFVRKIYEGVHRSSVDSLSAMQLMGFSGKSGASATALGSIRQFGLIEGTGDKTRVSDLALKILEPIDEQERALGVNEAGRYPDVFEQIFDRFDGRLPTVNEPIRAFLIRELGFSKSGADDCLESIRATLQFMENFPIGSQSSAVSKIDTDLATSTVPASSSDYEPFELHQQSPNIPIAESAEQMVIPLTRECKASLRFEGPVTEKALANLIRHIELIKETWAE